jgi:nucleotide-binding universal stress UspA family protein
MDNYAIIATYKNPKKAYYLKFKLGLEGIDAFLVESLPENFAGRAKQSTLKVQVNVHQVEKAVEVLFNMREELKTTSIDDKIKTIKRILVPIDFSKNSLTACLFAFALAQKLGAEIKLLHVFNDPFVDSGYIPTRASYQSFSRNVLLEIEEMAKKNLLAFLEELKINLKKLNLNDVKFHYNLRRGKPEYQIVNMAEAYKPYIIVVGAQGAGKMPSDIIGSVTTKVIENIEVPIIAIPESWEYKNFDKINMLYATDFQDSDHSALNKLLDITKPFDIKFNCIHIESNENAPWKEMQMFKLESSLNNLYPNTDIKCHLINHPNLLEGIQNFIDESNIDLISFTSPKRSIFYKLMFPNNLKKMIYQSKIPLLVFHS